MKLTAVAIRAAKIRNEADKLLDGSEVCTWMEAHPPFSRMSDVVWRMTQLTTNNI